jgi:riboflavin transporter FmnP
MVLTSGFAYQRQHTIKDAIISLAGGSLVMTVISGAMNYFVLLPLYSNFIPVDELIVAFSAFMPTIHTKLDVVLFSVIPFNLIKVLLISTVTFLLYKRLNPLMKGGRGGHG